MDLTSNRVRLRRVLSAFIAGTALSWTCARAEEAPTTVIVIDGSASMWGRLPPDSRPKIDVARETLSAAVQGAPQTRIGVVSFGQRRADCTDADVINAPDTQHEGALQTLAKLNPRGRGPLAFAIRAAQNAIGASRPARVLVVGDGADNCAQDACKAAADFAKAAPDVTIDVVGVAVPETDRPLVSCVATETGGRYVGAETAPEFSAALDELAKPALFSTDRPAAGPPPAAAGAAVPALPPPPTGASLRVAAALAQGKPPIDDTLKWRLYKAGENKPAAESEGRAVALKLPPGDYEIEAEIGGLKSREKVSIAPGSAQSISIALGASHLVARAGAGKNGAPSPGTSLSVTTPEKTLRIARGGSADLYLRPGTYTVVAADGTARQSREVTLAEGDDTTVDLTLRTGAIELSTAASATGAVPADVLYIVAEDDPYSPTGRREVARSRAPSPRFTLPAGTYYVSAQSGYAFTDDRVALGVGDDVKRTLTLDAATLDVTATIGGAPPAAGQSVVFKIERRDGDKAEVARSIGSPARFSLAPGSYRVTATLPGAHLSASREIAVAAGKAGDVQIPIPGAMITFSPTATGRDIYWEVTDTSGAAVWRATGGVTKAVLAPGAYTVHLDARGKRKSAPFEVRDGENRTMEIGPG